MKKYVKREVPVARSSRLFGSLIPLLMVCVPVVTYAGESLTTWGNVHIGASPADTSNGLYLRNYIAPRSDEVQHLHGNPSIYFIDINDSTKAWISDAGNFPTPEATGDHDIAVIDWESDEGTIDHTGYYAVINDTVWDPAVHSVQQFSDCWFRMTPVPDTISTAGQVELIWNAALEDPGIPDTTNIAGYNVYRGHDGIDFPLRVNANIVFDTFFTDISASIGDSVYYYAIKLVYRGVPDTIESKYFSANSPMIRANSDIGVLSIDSPADSIEPDSIEPVITIKNTGCGTPHNFYVKCRIDSLSTSVFSESLLVDSLLPDSSLSLVFPYWHPGFGGNSYVVNGFNLLSDDANPLNDTLGKNVVVFLHDVGVDSLISPGDTIDVGAPMDPSITVRNFGNTGEGFPVLCQIDSMGVNIYAEAVSVDTLKPDSIEILSFPSWTPQGEGNYTFYFITQLAGDVVPANDTLVFSTHATGIEEDRGQGNPVSATFALHQNFPNPFTTSTTICFTLPGSEGSGASVRDTELRIYDVTGRMVKSFLLSGIHSLLPVEITWDGRDNTGKRVSEGIYFVRFNADDFRTCKKIILVR